MVMKCGTDEQWMIYKQLNRKFLLKLQKYNGIDGSKVIQSKAKFAIDKLFNSRVRSKPSLATLLTEGAGVIRTYSGRAELLADTFAQSFSPDFEPAVTREQQFPTMSNSTWLRAEEIYSFLR